MFDRDELRKILIGLDYYKRSIENDIAEMTSDLNYLQSDFCTLENKEEDIKDEIAEINEGKSDIVEIDALMLKVSEIISIKNNFDNTIIQEVLSPATKEAQEKINNV